MTRSAGQIGLMFSGSPPSFFTASRMAAKSTTAGTPVKSYHIGMKMDNRINAGYRTMNQAQIRKEAIIYKL